MLALGLVAATGAVAGRRCATRAEVTAIQAAAVQQELMVAALTCNDTSDFNAFQTSYSRELRRSDWHLLHMFQRLYGGMRGRAKYHAFKTRLANNSSIRSIHDTAAYCHQTQLVFTAALASSKPSLAELVSGVAVDEKGPVDACQIRVATGLGGVKAAPGVTPIPNPLRLAALHAVAPAAAPAESAATAPATAPASAAAASPTPAKGSEPPAGTASSQERVKPATPAQTAKAQTEHHKKKSSGWLSSISGIFD